MAITALPLKFECSNLSFLFANSSCIFGANITARQKHLLKKFKEVVYIKDKDQWNKETEEKTILTLCPNHPDKELREILFILESNEKIAVWEGHKYTKEEAQNTLP